MATLAQIVSGKTGNYFKLEDLGEDFARIVESIDFDKTDIRSEKVKVKEGQKNSSGRDEIEYYHILVRVGDIEKDMSLTYTMLRQLADMLPRENVRGYQFKFLGSKGSGKNIKYNFLIGAKIETEQTRLVDQKPPISDVGGKLLEEIAKEGGMLDDAFWAHVGLLTGGKMADSSALVDRLKTEGRIIRNGEGRWLKTT